MKRRLYEGRLVTFLLVSTLSIFLFYGEKVFADATSNPRVQVSDLQYLGAFRMPQSQNFSYANDGVAYNAANNSLFVKCMGANFNDTSQQKVAEVSIPTIVNSTTINSLNTATIRQNCADITEGHLNPQNITNGMVLGGLLVYNNKLIGSEWAYYDGASQQTTSHFTHSLTLNQTGTYQGQYGLTVSPVYAGFVGGYMTTIPSEWQSLFGYPALTGSCCHAIISHQSTGPSVWGFDPDKLGVQNPVPATPLVYYTLDHPTLGTWGHPLPPNPVYNIMTMITGVIFPSGTRSVILFGRTGLGEQCYGGTTQAGTGECNDPIYPQDKGTHAYPYAYYVWMYDANDFLSVKNGTKNPWDITPYYHGQLTLPFTPGNNQLNGAAYDPTTKRIYVSQYLSDNSPSYGFPIIHAFSLNTPPTTDTESPTWPAGTTFSASATSSSSITVTWSAATDNIGVTSYIVERCTGLPAACPDASFTQVGTPTASPFTDSTGLSPNTDYSYRVRVSDAAGNLSGWTNVVSAKTQVSTPAPAFTLTANPTSLTNGQSSTLTWSAVTNATSCTASGGAFTGSKSTSGGTQSVSPTSTITYTLSCTGAGGTTNQGATVTVISGTGRTVNVHTLSELYNAFSSEQANDTIVIYPDGSPYVLNSTALAINQPDIVVRGSTGNRDDVKIFGDAMSSGATIKIIFYLPDNASDRITIKDLTIGRVGWHAVKIDGNVGAGENSIIDNVRFIDTYEQMLKVASVGVTPTNGVTVKNSLFEYTSGNGPQYYIGGIDAHQAVGWVVQDNTFRNIKSPSASVAEHAIHLWDGIDGTGNNTIERNTIINCDRGIGLWLNSGGTIRNNMILHDGSGAYPDVAIDIQNSPNVRVYNNTSWIAASGYYTNIELRGSTSTGLVLMNNLVNKGIGNISAPSPTLTSNITTAQASWFVNVASNLHLASSVSSVVNQGVAVSGLTDDIDKQSRPQGNGIDIGADEYVSGGAFTPCNTVTTANFSQSTYNSYGAPFDAFQTSTTLINATCSSTDPHTIQATLGQTGDTTRIAYTKGYYYANNAWTQYTGTCTGALNGEWCQGSVSATITNPNISTASASAPAYFVGMTCSVQSGGWKCGCRDTTCSNFYWQIQGAGQ